MLLIDHLKKYHSFEERDFGPGLILRFNSRNGVNVLETHGTLKRLFSRHHFVPVSNVFRNGDRIKIRNGGELSRGDYCSWFGKGFVYGEFHDFSFASVSRDRFHYGLIRNNCNYEIYSPVLAFCGEIEVDINV
jgi:hypothetical protein